MREMIKYLHPDAPLISRNTLKTDLKNLHMREKQKVKFMLNGCLGRICLTIYIYISVCVCVCVCVCVSHNTFY
jgi:hypothetical protein